jgi:MFS transporter, DHA2 family, multidrug resistance protein
MGWWWLASCLVSAPWGIALATSALLLTASAGSLPQLLAMSIFGLGLGSSFSVASHTIMNEAPPERAGMAASIEEVAFELGGAICITILGTLLAGVYSALFVIPKGAAVPASALDSIDQALKAAETLPADAANLLTQAVHGAFDAAYLVTLAVDAVALLAVAYMAWRASTAARAHR